MGNDELAVLQALRLKGRAAAEELAALTVLDAEEVGRAVAALVKDGELRELKGAYMLSPAGREHLTALLEGERANVDGDAAGALYEDFVSVNGEFKQLAADWQTRAGEPNDHGDADYDRGVLTRLPGIHARVVPIVSAASELVPRLSVYGNRLDAALERVQAGDHSWLLRPLIDSYHTVWFELHEELIGMTGRSREAEAVAGRAE